MKISVSLQNDLSQRHAKIFLAGIVAGMVQWLVILAVKTIFPGLSLSFPRYFGQPRAGIASAQSVISERSEPFTSAGQKTVALGVPVSAYALVSMDTNTILSSQNLSQPLPIASLTKLMTAMIALDMIPPDEKITVSAHAARQIPTKIGLRPGDTYTRNQLLTAALIPSANDAAQALADHVDSLYGSGTFIRAMNAKAQTLGMRNTRFDNPMGLDSRDNHSTVYDLALLTRNVLRYPEIVDLSSRRHAEITLANRRTIRLSNWNGLLGSQTDITGLKTGITAQAGHTTIVTTTRNGTTYAAIILGARSSATRDLAAHQLLVSAMAQAPSFHILSGGRQPGVPSSVIPS